MKRTTTLLRLLAAVLISSASHATTQIVQISNYQFSPASFTIALGDTVKWMWVSGSHTTTSSSIPSGAAAWNASLASSGANFVYVPAVAGAYNYVCTPHASMGMVGSFNVTCSAPATPVVTVSGTTTACASSAPVLSTSATGVSYQWKNNGTAISGATSASYTPAASGSYSVTITSSCGSATSAAISITINPNPQAGFTMTHTGLSYTFTNTTTGGSTYLWNFGDNQTSTQSDPQHTYAAAGTYVITLTATSSAGCTGVKTQTVSAASGIGVAGGRLAPAVYPNPAADVLYLTGVNEPASLYLYDVTGRLVSQLPVSSQSQQTLTASIREVPAGVYWLQIRTAGQVASLQLVITR